MKLKVEMSSFYGCDCMGCGYSSNDECDITIDEETAKVVEREILAHGGSLTNADVRHLIDEGVKELEPLHGDLWDRVVQMDIEYWLEQGDDGCGTINQWMEEDLNEKRFVPTKSFEDYLADNDVDTSDEGYDEDEWRDEYDEYLMDEEYRNWVAGLNKWARADRYGLDLCAVIYDCNGSYTISIESPTPALPRREGEEG